MTTDDELGAELRRDLQRTVVPFDAARADEMIDVAAAAELISARRYWAAPAAAAAAVVAVGGTAAVLAAGHGGSGAPAGSDPTTSSPKTGSAPLVSWSCGYIVGKGAGARTVIVKPPAGLRGAGAPTAAPGTSLSTVAPGGTVVITNARKGHDVLCRLAPSRGATITPTLRVSHGQIVTPTAPPKARPTRRQIVTTPPPQPTTSVPETPGAPLTLPPSPTS